MTITCPACGKLNHETPDCPRCGCELEGLRHIVRAAQRAVQQGNRHLADGEAARALTQAKQSWRLKKSPSAARLAFLACLACGNFSEAGRWYRVAAAPSGSSKVETSALLNKDLQGQTL